MRIRCNPEKRLVRSFGFRVGYWYCIPSPFLQVNVMKRYWSFWVELGDKRWTPAELSADRKALEPDYAGMDRDDKIRAIHEILHPGVDQCDKFWCMSRIPALVDDMPVGECPDCGWESSDPNFDFTHVDRNWVQAT